MSVIDGASCNGKVTSRLRPDPAPGAPGEVPRAVAVNQATDTVYALNPGTPGTVSVIDGATLQRLGDDRLRHVPPTVTVGNGNVVTARR